MKQFTLKSLLLMLTIFFGGVNAWGQDNQVLFHESFGNNSSSARVWDDSYSVKTGIDAVFSGISAYSVENVKQGKNTTGKIQSGLNQSQQNVDASIIIGPLNTADCSNMELSYYWKAGSIKGSYSTTAYYSTSFDGEYTLIGEGSNGATSFVLQKFNMPEEAQVSTLYLKIVWNTSNTQAIIDEVDLSGIYTSGPSTPVKPTFSLAEGTYWTEQTLELTTIVEGGTILYTTDGSDPTTSETAVKYSTALTISETTTFKACVKDTEGHFSAVAERTYAFVSSIANNLETAYTTAEAIELINKTSTEQLAAEDQKVYVKGTVSKVDSYNSGSITYWLDDNTFEVYSGKRLDGANFDAMSDVEVGASVVVYGNVKKFGTTYEFDTNSSLVEHVLNTLSSISISGDPDRVTYEEGESFDWAGLTVTAIFTDENTGDVTNSTTWTVTPETLTTETTEVVVTATYKEVVATKTIPVSVSKALPKVTIDLSKNQTTTATTEKIEWVLDDIVVNSIRENSSNTAANNYYPGKPNLTSTRFYKNNSFNVIPAYYVIIKQITYTATTEGYAKALADSKWTNATASADGMTVTIVPEDGAQPITAIIGATTGASSIVVSYEIIDHAEVELPATDGTANYATFSSDRAVEFVDATVYAVNVVNGVLQLNEVTSKQVPAGTGVLLKSEKETAPYFYINEAATIGNNLLMPASKEMSDISGDYTFYKLAYDNYEAKTGLGFYWGEDNGGVFNVKAGTAYLAVPNAVSVKGFLLDGTPTAIEGVEAENNTDVIYNLSGQRVQKAQRGLYIVNGKKLMVK